MAKRKSQMQRLENFRLNPERRLCSKFDSRSIAKFRLPTTEEMGFRVVDNCAEDHIM